MGQSHVGAGLRGLWARELFHKQNWDCRMATVEQAAMGNFLVFSAQAERYIAQQVVLLQVLIPFDSLR